MVWDTYLGHQQAHKNRKSRIYSDLMCQFVVWGGPEYSGEPPTQEFSVLFRRGGYRTAVQVIADKEFDFFPSTACFEKLFPGNS